MIRSLNTGVLGIKQFQQGLDTVGNNLANINTVGYKASRVDFTDTLAQTLRAPTPDSATASGTMGMQVGNGVRVSAIKNAWTQGAVKQTGVRTDLAVVGEGFFLVKDPISGELYATRAGDFREDANGFLVTNGGLRVQGKNDVVNSATQVGDVMVDRGNYASSKTLTSTNVGRAIGTGDSNIVNFNAATGANVTTDIITTAANHGYTTGDVVAFGVTASSGTATLPSGIVAGTAYYVRSLSATTLTLHSTSDDATSGANKVDISVVGNGTVRDATLKITGHGYVTGNQVMFEKGVTMPTTVPKLSANTAYFVRKMSDDILTLHETAAAAAAGTHPIVFEDTGTGNHKLAPGASISSYSFGADGKINMLLTDGTQYVRGQVLLQKFANPHALMKQGSNVFTGLESAGPLTGGTLASSTTILSSAAAPNSNGLGRLEAGALEMSNVDMAGEFSTLITTQRAFQANARVISASDEILQEMMALKR